MTRNKFTNKILVLIVAITMCTVFLPSGAAASHEEFGSLVAAEDNDFRPTLTNANGSVEICRADFGQSDRVQDDAFYLGWDDSTGMENFDVRLTERGGNGPGTLIMDDDTTEKGATLDCSAEIAVEWIDADDDDTFTGDDFVYIGGHDSGETGAPSAVTGSSTDEYWIRLTDTPGGDAGTLVFSGDDDLVNYGDSQTIDFAVGFFDSHNSGDFIDGDWAYITTNDDGADSFPGLYDVRLVHETEDFGSSVSIGDADFIPTLEDLTVNLCRLDFGQSGVISDDAFYLSFSATGGDNLANYDIRLTERGGNAPGSLVLDGDNTEKTTDIDSDGCDAVDGTDAHVIGYDVDNDGDRGADDYYYIGTDASNDPPQLVGSSDTGETWIRLSDTPGGDAGSIVLAGDQDVRTYGSQDADFDITSDDDMSFKYFDADSTDSFTPDDSGYLSIASDDAPAKMFDIRIVNDDEEFASLVLTGDDDFVPTLEAGVSLVGCRANLGQSDRIIDDSFYLSVTGSTSELNNFDIRLTAYQDQMPGTLVGDADTTEKNAVGSDCENAHLIHHDVNNNNRFDEGDHLFLGTDGTLAGSTHGGDWFVRLTDTSSHDAGTLVRATHDDLITYGGGDELTSSAGDNHFGWFDAANTGAFTTGDWAYVSPSVVSATGGDTPALFSMRASGSFDVDETPTEDEGPSITIDAPTDGEEVDVGASVEISGTAEAGDNDIENVTVTVGDEELDVEGTTEWSATWDEATAGTSTITATVTDTEGNSDTATVSVTAEEETPDAPEISITSPSDGTEIQPGEEVTVEGTASGEDVEVTVTAGDEDLDVSGTEDWSATWMAGEEAGSFVITATVTDSADQTASDSVTVSVAEETTDDDEVDDSVDDDQVDDETTDDEVETPGFTALAALIATVGMAALLRRN